MAIKITKISNKAVMCPALLKDQINADATISAVCLDVRVDNFTELTFDFDVGLTPAEDAQIDSLVANLDCAALDLQFGNVNDVDTPTPGGFHDVFVYGSHHNIGNKFLDNAGNDNGSVESAPIAIADGEVVHMTISTENSNANFYAQVVTGAIKGGSGALSGGTQIGNNIEKPVGSSDYVITGLAGFNFNAGDRIAVYVKKGTTGGGRAKEPIIRLFVRYN